MASGSFIVAEYCRESQLPFERMGDNVVVFSVEEPNGDLLSVADANRQRFILQTLYPFLVPRQKRRAMCTFTARASYKVEIGALTFDEADGEIGFRTGIQGDVAELGAGFLAAVIEHHLLIATQWLPGVAAVCFNDVSPVAALQLCSGLSAVTDVIEHAIDGLADGNE
jgi:hypothetical protein